MILVITFMTLIGTGSGITENGALVDLASVIQVLTGIEIIIFYNRSRKREKETPVCGVFGTLPFL